MVEVPGPCNWRYQMVVGTQMVEQKNERRVDVLYVFDTQTGQVWQREWGRDWEDRGSPIRKGKKD